MFTTNEDEVKSHRRRRSSGVSSKSCEGVESDVSVKSAVMGSTEGATFSFLSLEKGGGKL